MSKMTEMLQGTCVLDHTDWLLDVEAASTPIDSKYLALGGILPVGKWEGKRVRITVEELPPEEERKSE